MTNVLYDVPGPKARRLLAHRRRSSASSSIALGLAALVILALAAPRVTAGGAELPGMFDPSRWDILLDRAVWRAIGDGLLEHPPDGGRRRGAARSPSACSSRSLRTARRGWIRVPDDRGARVLPRHARAADDAVHPADLLAPATYWAGVDRARALQRRDHRRGAARRHRRPAARASARRDSRSASTPLQTRFSIEFPQAFRQMLPIIIAQLVVLLKDTSLAYVIGYPELLRTIDRQAWPNFYGSRYLFTLFFVAFAIYLDDEPAAVVARAHRRAPGAAGRIPAGSSRISRRAAKRLAKQRADEASRGRRRPASSRQGLSAGRAPIDSITRVDPQPHHRERGR